MKKLLKKLKSTRGESISETLISSLVIALGFIIAVTMIVSATNMVSKASTSWNKYYDEKNKLEGQSGGVEGKMYLSNDTAHYSKITIIATEDGSMAVYEKAK